MVISVYVKLGHLVLSSMVFHQSYFRIINHHWIYKPLPLLPEANHTEKSLWEQGNSMSVPQLKASVHLVLWLLTWDSVLNPLLVFSVHIILTWRGMFSCQAVTQASYCSSFSYSRGWLSLWSALRHSRTFTVNFTNATHPIFSLPDLVAFHPTIFGWHGVR